MKVDKNNLGMWVENHDTDRFLTLRWAVLLLLFNLLRCPLRHPAALLPAIEELQAASSTQEPAGSCLCSPGQALPLCRNLAERSPHRGLPWCRDSLPAYRNALAHVLLSESIPIM